MAMAKYKQSKINKRIPHRKQHITFISNAGQLDYVELSIAINTVGYSYAVQRARSNVGSETNKGLLIQCKYNTKQHKRGAEACKRQVITEE